jgi:pimeloyl-ACP methyl ester carboxylesterase
VSARARVRSMAAAMALGVLSAAFIAPTHAAAASGCPSAKGATVPVVLIHGFNSSAQAWDGGGVWTPRIALESLARVSVVEFDYSAHATEWVTAKAVGPALARYLLCISAASAGAGGSGKVVIVAHSMGGLAARCALDPVCGQAKGVADVVDLVVTVGTPNTGSFLRGQSGVNAAVGALSGGAKALASACNARENTKLNEWAPPMCLLVSALEPIGTQLSPLADSPASLAFTPGSPELSSLPPFPSTVAVYAFAGRITLVTHLFLLFTTEQLVVGDGVVSEPSALVGYHDGIAAEGGSSSVECGFADLTFGGADPICTHVTETVDSTFATEIARVVKTYLDTASVGRVVDMTTSNGHGIGGFQTPSGNIACLVTSEEARCDIRDHSWTLPVLASCEYESGTSLQVREIAEVACINDSISDNVPGTFWTSWFDPKRDLLITTQDGQERTALRYGSKMINGDYSCTVSRSGVMCANSRTGASFTMSQSAYSLGS